MMRPLSRLSSFLHRVTVGQWLKLEEEHSVGDPASGRDRAGLIGLYFVAMLMLIAIEYLPSDTYRALLKDELPRELRRFGRDLWWCWFVIVAYTLIPALYCRFVLRLKLMELGLNPRGFLKHAWIYVGLFLLVLPFVVGVSGTEVFQAKYPLFHRGSGADTELTRFLLWEASYSLQFVALEFFFRGVLLFGAVRVLGPWAIVAMVLPYMMIHFGKPGAEAVGAIFAGAALGLIALRTRSIYAGMTIHIAVAWSMDLLALWRKGKLAALLGLE
jgi:membrane protease YdiL (CAAX protease family)